MLGISVLNSILQINNFICKSIYLSSNYSVTCLRDSVNCSSISFVTSFVWVKSPLGQANPMYIFRRVC